MYPNYPIKRLVSLINQPMRKLLNIFDYRISGMEAKQERRLSRDSQKDVIQELKNFKDIDSIDDFNLDRIDLVKGDTPINIKDTCLKMCQDFLSGFWNQQTSDTIEVNRISGGLTNQLYYCGLINKSGEELDVPQEVAIRLYGPKYFDTCDNETNERLSDVVIGLIVSQNNFGTKIYGIHEKGQIQKFYKHKQFNEEQQGDKKVVKQVFQRLARIHTMDAPIKKNTNWLERLIENSYEQAFEKFPILDEIEKYKCQTLKNNDFKAELQLMKTFLKKICSPLVFTHNDFRSSNLLITEPNDELVVCDFEYASYGQRGHDFINIMREWGRNPWDFKSVEDLPPEDSVFRPLIEIYVEECVKIKGKSYSQNPINSADHILREAKVYLLNGQLMGTAFFMKNDEKNGEFPMNRKVSMELADNAFKNYFALKEKLIHQQIIEL